MNSKHETAGIIAILAACVLNVVMGAGFYFARKADPSYDAMSGVFIRVVCNLIFVSLPLLRGGAFPKILPFKQNRPLWLWGFCGLLNTTSFFQSISMVGAGLTSFLNAGSGIFIASLAPLLAFQRTPLRDWLGVLFSLFGLFLITSAKFQFAGQTIGFALGIFSGMASAIGYLMVARTRGKYGPETVMLHWTLVNLTAFSLYFMLSPPHWPQVSAAWIALVVTGLTAASAQYLTAKAYQNAPASLVACLTYLSPVISVVVDIVYFKIPFQTQALVGIFIVLIFGATMPLLRRRQERKS